MVASTKTPRNGTTGDARILPPEAVAAHLRYVSDDQPGIARRRAGGGFVYFAPDGRPVRDRAVLARIRALVLPPAWKDVWICPLANGHLQATGRDERGRKQYRYHERWRAVRDETKFDRMAAFGAVLPRMRARVRRDLRLPGMPRNKVLAAIVRLLDTTFMRVGNEDYARANGSFGLTTLRNRHVRVRGTTIHLSFRGKSGVEHDLDVRDRRLAKLLKRCRDLPGQELFQYLDGDGRRHSIDAGDVNEYIREISGSEFTTKDFRTWAGTILAAQAIGALDQPTTQRAVKAGLVAVVKAVAERLGNTVAVCRKCYIHPLILAAYGDDELRLRLGPATGRVTAAGISRAYERNVLRFLRHRNRLKRRTAA